MACLVRRLRCPGQPALPTMAARTGRDLGILCQRQVVADPVSADGAAALEGVAVAPRQTRECISFWYGGQPAHVKALLNRTRPWLAGGPGNSSRRRRVRAGN